MTAVFADTSFWIALTNEADDAYRKTQTFSSYPSIQIFSSDLGQRKS